MLRRESDGFFNMHAISFLTVAVFLTAFSIAYADWHVAKITGMAITSEQYLSFFENYLTDYDVAPAYSSEVNVCIDDQTEASCPDYIDNCIRELNGEIVIGGSSSSDEIGLQGCAFYLENVVSIPISDQESFNTWESTYVTPFVLTSQCANYISTCNTDSSCNGLASVCFITGSSEICNYFENECYVSETIDSEESTQPPKVVVEQVSEIAETVKGSANYAESVSEIIVSRPLSEADLLRYKANLEGARKTAVNAFKDTYDVSNKYNSFILSEYQQEIAIDLAIIEKQIREIDSILTDTVEERQELQTKQAIWTLEHEEDVENSFNILESFLTGMATLGDVGSGIGDGTIGQATAGQTTGETTGQTTGETTGTTTAGGETEGETISQGEPGGAQYTESDLRIVDPGVIIVPYQGITNFDIRVENHNDIYPLTHCRISPAGSNTEWLTWNGFENPQYGLNSLGPREFGIYEARVDPGNAPVGNYLINFRVFCNQEEDGLILQIEIQHGLGGGSGGQGQTGEIGQEDLNWLFENYPLSQLNNECSENLNECSSIVPNTCGVVSIFYNCAVNRDCEAFEELCVPTYISSGQMQTFMTNYVIPFYNIPYQCMEDIQACNTNSLNCVDYVYNCAALGICEEYIETCLYSAQSGTGGFGGIGASGGSTSSSSTTGTTTSQGTSGFGTTTGTSQPTLGEAFLDVCRGDERCLSLVQVCYPVSSLIATSQDLVDLGGNGFNPVTGKVCQIGPSLIYIGSNPGRPGTIISQFPGNTGQPQNPGNNVITIHFQNSLDGSRRNYVAAVVYSLNGHLTLNFLNSPDYNDLEDKIYEFIQNLLYGESGGSYVTGMSLQQAEEIVGQSTSIPWVLWIILFVMVICFVLFGNALSPYNERLISSGKKALNKNDYALAIQNYNALASSYSNDSKIKQDALEYLRQIKEKVGSSKINLEFAGTGELPKIKTNNSTGVFSDSSRVHRMIEHALHDLKNNPKLAKSRMHLISEEYRRLTPKDKEKLASSYESLVYKIRNL